MASGGHSSSRALEAQLEQQRGLISQLQEEVLDRLIFKHVVDALDVFRDST